MTYRFLIGLGVLNLLAVIVLSYFLFVRDSQIVYVDSVKLINEYEGMIHARADYKKKADAWKANIDTLGAEVQRFVFRYEKEYTSLSVKERQLSKELIQSKQKQFTDYQNAIQAQAQQEDAKMTNAVVAEINAYLKKYGESKGYKIVLTAANGNLAYVDESLDITLQVLAGLNNEYKGK
jgi:outer membrane protein